MDPPSIPFDVLGALIENCDKSVLASFALASHSLLPVARQHLYSSIDISSKNISHLLKYSVQHFSYTREVVFCAGIMWLNSTTLEDRAQILKILIHHAKVTHFDYQGRSEVADLRLILEIAALPSLTWLGIDLNIHRGLASPTVEILLSSHLRRLSLNIDTYSTPPIPSLPLPALKEMHFRAQHPNSTIALGLFTQWACWANLESVEILVIVASGAALPNFPSTNSLKTLKFGGRPDPHSLISNFPILHNLQTLTMEITTFTHLDDFLGFLPLAPPIHFGFILDIRHSQFQSFVDEREGWKSVVHKIHERVHDRHLFRLDLLARFIEDEWVAWVKDLFCGVLETVPIFIRELEDTSSKTRRVVKLAEH
ncbi:hypothetical protein DL96DRAFT_1682890 [Flagelloscypha sp. PMI_526]|nr:hypothetical protein DL96DRAFT_1682890 [Flagelloscypha sp. PMI_526]